MYRRLLFLSLFTLSLEAIQPHSEYEDVRHEEQRYPQRRSHVQHQLESSQYKRHPIKKWFPNQEQVRAQQFPMRWGGRATAPTDEMLRRQINRSLQGRDIGVAVNDGNVTLWGSVNSQQEWQMIFDRISTMNGVRNVNDLITVANTKAMPRKRRYSGGRYDYWRRN